MVILVTVTTITVPQLAEEEGGGSADYFCLRFKLHAAATATATATATALTLLRNEKGVVVVSLEIKLQLVE